MRMRSVGQDSSIRVIDGPLPACGRKRVDLVVTDCEFPAERVPGDETAHYRQEVRCTIPVALLDGNITHEALREAAHAVPLCRQDPLRAEEFLQFLGRVVRALQHSPQEPLSETKDDQARVERLTAREREVLEHVVAGDPNKLTAAALNISRRTVEHHRAAIMQKTRAKSVSELVRLALRTGLYTMEDDEDA